MESTSKPLKIKDVPRELRDSREDEVSANLEQTFGKSFTERVALIRNGLFDLNPINDPTRNWNPTRTEAVYASIEMLENRGGYQKFIDQVDDLYSTVSTMKSSKAKSEASIRLGAMVYALGIIIHPKNDGNGQTLRTVALSYIKEFSPQFAESKFEKRVYDKINGLDSQPFGNYIFKHAIEQSLPQGIQKQIDSLYENEYLRRSSMTDTFILYALGLTKQAKFDTDIFESNIRYIKHGVGSYDADTSGKKFANNFQESVELVVKQMTSQLKDSRQSSGQ